jgi:hypothetical protein
MDHQFPVQTGWVETPKLRKKVAIQEERKKAASVPTTPLQQENHFDILSPPSSPTMSRRKKKKKRHSPVQSSSNSIKSPLSNEIRGEWDDHRVPTSHGLDGLHIIRNEDIPESIEPEEPQSSPVDEQPPAVETLQQISFLDYLRDELTVADFDSAQELKRERVTNFLGVPAAIEKVN